MNKFNFWQKWFFITALIIIVLGLGLAFLGQTTIFNCLINNQINNAFYGTPQIPEDAFKYQRFIYGVLGAVVAGWGIVLAFIAQHPFKKKEKWVWKSIILGASFWFITDTGFSVYYKAYNNALMNTLLFIIIVLPLILTRNEFKRNEFRK